jgi:alpha-L-rhamnosidase
MNVLNNLCFLCLLLTVGIASLSSGQGNDHRGPVSPIRLMPVVQGQSVQSGDIAQAIKPGDVGPGVGRWIWSKSESKEVTRFRKVILLEDGPRLVRAWLTAETRYRVWINGSLAARGPADIGRDYDSGPAGPWLEDVRDLTRFFRRGPNIVAVEVFPEPIVQSESATGNPGLKIDFLITKSDGKKVSLGTDASWQCKEATDLNQDEAKNGYRIDMRKEPEGWQINGFEVGDWPQAIEVASQRKTSISELAPPMEAVLPSVGVTRVSDGVQPNAKTGGAEFSKDGTFSVQYGHVLSGYLGFRVMGREGARLLITPNEHDSPGSNRRAEIILRDGEQFVELPYMDSFSVVNIQAVGVTKPIIINDVKCVFTSYPVKYVGTFECSNPQFNRDWEVCRWATQICMQTHHLDSPHHQEPISDPGDYLIEALSSYYAFGEATLARQDLKKYARVLEHRKYQSFHTSYSLLWLKMLMQYYDYTGDAETVKELAPTANALLDQFETYIGPKGLISEAPNYMFMDWVEIDGFNLHHPPAVIGQGYMTALYYQALADGNRVARLTGDPRRQKKCASLMANIKVAFEKELWAEDAGLYRDGKPFQTSVKPNQWLPADKKIETFSTQVNTFAVSCGLASKERATEIMTKILGRADMNCQPYFMHFVFDAMTDAGLFNSRAVKQLERWKIVPDTLSFTEMWNTGDLSHAWIGTPLFQMSGRILGVEPTKPGFKEFRIAPNPCGLTWAKGVVPTPHGGIHVSWSQIDENFLIEFEVPKGTTAVYEGQQYSAGKHRLGKIH